MKHDFDGSSSLIRSIEYDPLTMTLRVDFATGSKNSYTYNGVPPSVVADFINAPSPGKFWNATIKGRY
jgi:lysyl-tRNA synthetase class 2